MEPASTVCLCLADMKDFILQAIVRFEEPWIRGDGLRDMVQKHGSTQRKARC